APPHGEVGPAWPGWTTMTEEQAFVEAIAAEPEQDAHRLVYADWLEDHEEPERAEFIRAQCELARLDEAARANGAGPARRARQLLKRHERAWLGPLTRFCRGWEFRRGLLEVVTIEARDFLEHALRLFRSAPVRHIRFLNARDLLLPLLSSAHLGR